MVASVRVWDRRRVLGFIGAGALAGLSRGARADTLPHAIVFRDPSCGCCHDWVEHLRANGFTATMRDTPRMAAIKARLGVPRSLASCHTAEIGGYVIEGHVPADAIKRLLAEKPEARGLAVPGMPIGSPGMEGGTPETYEVILFGDGAEWSYGTFREDKAV
ncbi:MAG TPA: DUF411 domain-containing protein [Hyphomicrobium sp.]|nr:DUF411 domain-containing protein [Hyphomicrobium sp.]HRO50832.1 DUF411 domain-containing protein [Hyphomicrobium sp.]